MKASLRVFVVTISLVMVFSQCEKEPDPNRPVTIPDVAFFNALIEEGVDTNGDGKISYKEAEVIISLDIQRPYWWYGGDIYDMTGIEAFENLDTLRCGMSLIKSIDFSANTKLRYLDFSFLRSDSLFSVDLTNNSALETLICDRNDLQILKLLEAELRGIFDPSFIFNGARLPRSRAAGNARAGFNPPVHVGGVCNANPRKIGFS